MNDPAYLSSVLIAPDWPAPVNVRALVTTRRDPVGHDREFDLGTKQGPEGTTRANRCLMEAAALPEAVQWLDQRHGTAVFEYGGGAATPPPVADAVYTRAARSPGGILTADCMPVFFCNDDGDEVALAHAGWRGLAGGVLENTLAAFRAGPSRILAWLGPAIGPCHFEVGEEVRTRFLETAPAGHRDNVAGAFEPGQRTGKWMADLYRLATIRLTADGVGWIGGGGFCTFCDKQRFYSWRRDKDNRRFASLIWME